MNYMDFFNILRVFLAGINLILLIYFIYLARNYFKQLFQQLYSKIQIKYLVILLVLFVISIGLKLFFYQPEHIMYLDEPMYMNAAKEISLNNIDFSYNKSIGWPFVLSIFFRIFGINNILAIYINALFGSLTLFLVFLFVFKIFNSERIALLSSFLFIFLPSHIRWSMTTETNISSLFFLILSLFLMMLFFKNKFDRKLLYLSFFAVCFSSIFRIENYIVFVIFILGLFLYRCKSVFRIRTIFLLFLISLLVIPNLIVSLNMQLSKNWISSDSGGKLTGDNFSFNNLIENSINFAPSLFSGNNFPIFILFLAIICLFFVLKQKQLFTDFTFIFLWAILFYLIYFISWLQTLGGSTEVFSKTRFMLNIYLGLIILGSFVIEQIILFIYSKFKINKFVLFSIIFIVIIIYYFSSFIVLTNIIPSKQFETKLPSILSDNFPNSCLMVSTFPIIIYSSTIFKTIEITDNILLNLNNNTCRLFIEDYFCFDPNFNTPCIDFKNKYNLTINKTFSYMEYNMTVYNIN